MKLFDGPSEPDASLGELGSRKTQKKTLFDAILPRKGPATRAMSKRLQEDLARAVDEGPRVLMNLRVNF